MAKSKEQSAKSKNASERLPAPCSMHVTSAQVSENEKRKVALSSY